MKSRFRELVQTSRVSTRDIQRSATDSPVSPHGKSPRYAIRMPLALQPRQRKDLKARAHALEPIVQIGQAGASDAAVAEVDRALTAHELIKVRLAGDRDQRDALATTISERTGSAIVQQVGRIVVLWRPKPDEDDENT